MENYYPELYFGSIHILIAIVLFCALLLWGQREEGQRSRYFLVWTWFFLLALCGGWLPMIYRGNPAFEGVLPVNILVVGLALMAMMTLYPIEVVIPRRLNAKWLLLLFSPALLALAVCGGIQLSGGEGGGFRMLNTLGDIASYWHEPNVWIRFLIILLICGYAFILCYIPQNKMQGSITLNWVRGYTAGNMGIALLFIGMILLGTYLAGVLYMLCFAFYVAYVTYQELYVRLFIPDSEKKKYAASSRRVSAPELEEDKKLWAKLNDYMQEERAWHNPNLSIFLLADAVGVEHVRIAILFNVMGYDEFDDYVGDFRIREFCNLVGKGDSVTMEDTFYRVGFRYRDVASGQFLRVMHQSPEEYLWQMGRTKITKK